MEKKSIESLFEKRKILAALLFENFYQEKMSEWDSIKVNNAITRFNSYINDDVTILNYMALNKNERLTIMKLYLNNGYHLSTAVANYCNDIQQKSNDKLMKRIERIVRKEESSDERSTVVQS